MKTKTTVVLVAALGAAFLALAPAATAATPTQRIAKLEAQVKQLQKRVVALNVQLQLNFEGDTCLTAQSADLFQGTWQVVDQIAQATQAGKTYFGAQAQVDDFKNCADLAQPDVPRPGIKVPPTISPLLPLLQWLHEPL